MTRKGRMCGVCVDSFRCCYSMCGALHSKIMCGRSRWKCRKTLEDGGNRKVNNAALMVSLVCKTKRSIINQSSNTCTSLGLSVLLQARLCVKPSSTIPSLRRCQAQFHFRCSYLP